LKTLISIVGPTAIGKTALALELGKRFNTEIISADSRQLYREMSIGTAKPSQEELNLVPHHFIDSHSIKDDFSAGDFEKEALAKIESLFQQHDLLLLVGGSGLFVNSIIDGLDDLPKAKEGVREALNQSYKEKGIDFIRERLREIDPSYYSEVDISNPQRMIRAIEVFDTTGIPFSAWRKNKKKERKFKTISIGLTIGRPILYERINHRVDCMVNDGLLKEVESLYPYKGYTALQTVGYSELFDYLDGKYSIEEAVEKIKQNTRKYAKRQLTWFRKNENTTWFEPNEVPEIIKYLESNLYH
jgi:tRNA dimethylallyltransferase